MKKIDSKILNDMPKDKIGIASFSYIIKGAYKEILDELKKIDSKFDSKIEVEYEHGKEIKENVVFFHRNEKTRLCLAFTLDEEKEKFVLYYPYYSEAYSICVEDSNTRRVFKRYNFNEYYDLLEIIENILENPKSDEIIRELSKKIFVIKIMEDK